VCINAESVESVLIVNIETCIYCYISYQTVGIYFFNLLITFLWISDRTLKVWSLDGISEDSEEPINLKTRSVVAAHDKDINSVAVARNDSLVCTGSEVRQYDEQTFVV